MQAPLPYSPRSKDESSSASEDLLSTFETMAISASSSDENLFDHKVAVTALNELALARNAINPSQERAYKVACEAYNTKAIDLSSRAFKLLNKDETEITPHDTNGTQEKQQAYLVIQKAIHESKDTKLDNTLYTILTAYPQAEAFIIQQLASYLFAEIKTHKERESLFREDCAQLKVLRVIQSGHLRDIFKRVERYAQAENMTIFALAASPFKLLNEHLKNDSLPENFFTIYRTVYNAMNEKYLKSNCGPARQVMLQLIFLRGINPFLTNLSQKYSDFARKCIDAAKLIQSALSDGKAPSQDSKTIYGVASEFSLKLAEKIQENAKKESNRKANGSKKSLLSTLFA